MVPANPSAEGLGASPVQPQPSGPGDGRHTAPRVVQHHPAVLEQQQQRVHSFELRLADGITAFAGSMKFVYLHVVMFAVWMLFIERRPWATLTLIVSLEAIFLSTFVMIGQNRQAAFQQAKADHCRSLTYGPTGYRSPACSRPSSSRRTRRPTRVLRSSPLLVAATWCHAS